MISIEDQQLSRSYINKYKTILSMREKEVEKNRRRRASRPSLRDPRIWATGYTGSRHVGDARALRTHHAVARLLRSASGPGHSPPPPPMAERKKDGQTQQSINLRSRAMSRTRSGTSTFVVCARARACVIIFTAQRSQRCSRENPRRAAHAERRAVRVKLINQSRERRQVKFSRFRRD